MEVNEDFILHMAKKAVAIEYGYVSWEGIGQMSVLLDKVAIKYGELLLNFHNTNKRVFPEDMLHDAVAEHITINLSDHNSLFSNKVLKMRQAGFSSNDIVFNLVDAGSDLFAKFQKLIAAWPIQYSKLPENL